MGSEIMRQMPRHNLKSSHTRCVFHNLAVSAELEVSISGLLTLWAQFGFANHLALIACEKQGEKSIQETHVYLSLHN